MLWQHVIEAGESKMKYSKQIKLCLSITRNVQRSYYKNLDLKDITIARNVGLQ